MKEKAKAEAQRLLNQYIDIMPNLLNQTGKTITDHAKLCAKIAIKELIKEQTMWQNRQPDPVNHWQLVLEELNKL